MIFYSFIDYFLPVTDVIMTLLQYLFVAIIIPFSYEDKRLHNIEQRTIDASIGQWYS